VLINADLEVYVCVRHMVIVISDSLYQTYLLQAVEETTNRSQVFVVHKEMYSPRYAVRICWAVSRLVIDIGLGCLTAFGPLTTPADSHTRHPLHDTRAIKDVFVAPKRILDRDDDRYTYFLRFLDSATESISIHSSFMTHHHGSKDSFYLGLVDLLREKEIQGVSIRIRLDGCIAAISWDDFSDLHDKWLEFVGNRSRWNYTQSMYHRKFCLIDQTRAMITGANLTHGYFGGRTESTLVPTLRDVDAYTEDPDIIAGLSSLDQHSYRRSDMPMRLSSWSDRAPPVRVDCAHLLTELLQSASTRMVIFTGLFEPDDVIMSLLCATARRGVECTIFMSFTPFFVASAYRMIDAGVRIRIGGDPTHTTHSKIWRVDDGPVWLGSCNLTRRSMNLDREMMVCFDTPEATESFDAMVVPNEIAKSVELRKIATWHNWRITTSLNWILDRLDIGIL